MEKKIIFLDIDGTIMDFNGNIPDSAKEALIKAKKAGHELVLCTGRTKSEIYPELVQMGFDGLIASAGAYVEHHGKKIHQRVIHGDALNKMIAFFNERKMVYCLQTEEGVVMTQKNQEGFRDYFLKMGLKEETIWKVLVAPIIIEEDSRERKNVEKAAYYGAPVSIPEVEVALGSDFCIQGASYGNNTTTNGELTRISETKATGIEKYLTYTGGALCDTIGIGDGLNDMEMMSKTAYAIAMGNAKREIKAMADFITDSVDRDGLWKAFVHMHLI